MIFSIFTELCNHHYNLRTFSSCQKEISLAFAPYTLEINMLYNCNLKKYISIYKEVNLQRAHIV